MAIGNRGEPGEEAEAAPDLRLDKREASLLTGQALQGLAELHPPQPLPQ